ncbi:hypothetical protein FHETE_11023, partial [Fusarium heterosporum]
MATGEYEPGDVIYLSSGDERAAAAKKRPLEDASRSKSPDGQTRRSKRLRTVAPSTHVQDSEDSSSSSSEEEKGAKKAPAKQKTSGNSRSGKSKELPDFKHLDLSFKLPKLADSKGGSWLKRFKDWIKSFHAANIEICEAITPVLAESAYGQCLDQHSGLKVKKRKNAKQVAKEYESTGELEAFLKSLQPPRSNQSILDTWVRRDSQKEPVHKGKRSRGSSVSEGEIDETNENESESEAEYEPTLSKNERAGEGPLSTTNVTMNGDSAPKASSHQNLPPIDTHRNVPTGNDALEQQRRYFPSASDPAQMCLLCGLNTHLAPCCPTLICSFCGSLEHADVCCPDKERCSKCRQLGHRASQCAEKLALTKDEGLTCVFCSSNDHLEKECTQVWRSFHPDVSTVRKVAFIPASCSMCGSDRHFSSECSSHRGALSNPTWSLKNRDQYVDPECGMAAIEEAIGGQHNAKAAKGAEFRIRGHAARTTNVHYSESDDSEVEFLGHKRVQKPAIGQIRMASNLQMPNIQNGRPRRNNNQSGGPAQPPLPPGPPPSGPPPMRGSFRQGPPPGPASSLPRKPPTQDFRNVPPPHQQSSQGQGRS